jgi:two-component system LytT family response regulator
MKWQAVIVDDERLARMELRRLLQSQPNISVAGEASTIDGALERLRLTGANLVFLDIQLKGESGFDLLSHLAPEVAVVFVTAFDEYAVQAFEVHALDYLLKPVAPERLADAMDNLNRRGRIEVRAPGPLAEAAEEEEQRPERLSLAARLFLRIEDRMGFLAVAKIRAVLADGDHAIIITLDGQRLKVRKPLREWILRLPEEHFLQIHRGALVNLNEVQRLDEWSHGSFHVHLRGEPTPLIMSRRFAARVRAQLG